MTTGAVAPVPPRPTHPSACHLRAEIAPVWRLGQLRPTIPRLTELQCAEWDGLAEFQDDKDIRVMTEKQTVKFLFKDQVFTKFKKGNDKGVGSNIETQAVLDFIDPNRLIPGLLPDILRVEFCYGIDALGECVAWIELNVFRYLSRARTRSKSELRSVWIDTVTNCRPIATSYQLSFLTQTHNALIWLHQAQGLSS